MMAAMAEGTGAHLEAGSLFAGDYRIVRPLAEGGMGAVYVVEQLSTGKSRALKLMKPELAQDAQSRQRFELEAKIGARIESDHVVEIQSAGVESKTPYIVMELLDGEDLRTRIDRTGPVSPIEARDIFEQLCHAVAAAHAAGIIHRDLKPENVFLAKTKRAGGDARASVKVLDFGIAKLVAESATRGGTMGMIGTPMWMSPEQTELGKIGPAADVWALGLILYFVLTGESYWLAAASDEGTLTQLLKEVVMGPLPSASMRAREQNAAGSIPPEVDPIFARCVVRDPSKRYQDAAQLWTALGSALAPPSVRIVAGGTAAGPIDATMPGPPVALELAAMPRSRASRPGSAPDLGPPGSRPSGHEPTVGLAPLPLAPFPQQPYAHVPPFRALGVKHDAGMSITRDKRIWVIPIVIVAMIGVFGVWRVAMRARNAGLQAERDDDSETDRSGSGVLPGPMQKTGQRDQGECRLCATQITAKGPVPRDAISDAVKRGIPMLDQQCMRAGSRRGRQSTLPGSMSYAFAVRNGLPANRRIERGSSNPSLDECILRGLGDLTFPSSDDETEVSVVFSFDPRKP
jgi:tRNA A-37 threonylcarbamoyl transferase component Bud32